MNSSNQTQSKIFQKIFHIKRYIESLAKTLNRTKDAYVDDDIHNGDDDDDDDDEISSIFNF